ncbi:MAG: serine/threonine protein kinase [Kofleriaceae bacterium]
MIGTTVGSYRIVSKLSIGGMGTVYRAEHTLIGKTAAVKILHPELSANQEIVDRFFNEAKATTTIKHPGIVDVFDFGYMDSGHAFLVMEFLEGMSLAKRCKAGRTSEGEAALLLRSVCSALTAAHERHIVHRDLKPDNIFLVPDTDSPLGVRPKILDFGIAKLTDIGMAGTGTKTGAVMGTPTYMSPEQCRGTGQVDHRADLYSIGCIFYEMITGRPPFTNLGAGELIGAHLYVPPQLPSKFLPTITPESLALIMALLEKNPTKRPQTAKELGARLLAIAHMHEVGLNTPNPLAHSLAPLPVPAPRSPTDEARFDEEPDTVPSEPKIVDRASPTMPSQPPVRASAIRRSDDEAEVLDKPTTLSGAATSSIIDVPKRSRRGLFAGVAAVAVIAIGGIALMLGNGGKGDGPATKPNAPAPASAPVAAPTPPAPTPPAPTEPAPAVVIETGSGSGSATELVVADTKPVVDEKPAKPTKPTKPKPTKPTKKPEKKNTLIETDL